MSLLILKQSFVPLYRRANKIVLVQSKDYLILKFTTNIGGSCYEILSSNE